MAGKELSEQLEKTFGECLAIVEKKNHDYTGGGADAFKNFRSAEVVGVTVERAILVRTLDKMARISGILETEAKVEDEKYGDTIKDAINYLGILKAVLDEKKAIKAKKAKK